MSVTIESIIDASAKHFRFKRADLLAKRKSKTLNRARVIAMFIAREYTDYSFPEIASVFERVPGSIIWSHNRLKARRKDYRDDVAAIRAALEI